MMDEKRLNRWRWLAMAVSTLLSVSIAASIGWAVFTPKERPEPGRNFAPLFVDADGRVLSSKPGALRLVYDPFTIYRTAPSQQTSSYTIDEHGFRGGMANDGRPVTFVVGGSVAFGQELHDDGVILSAQIERFHPASNIVNAGVVGYLSGQELSLMVHYLDDFHPEAYVVFDGWNELFDQHHFNPRSIDRLGFNNTVFEIEDRLHRLSCTELEQPYSNRPTTPDNVAILEKVVERYLKNVECMHAFAKARGAKFLFVIEPELGCKPQHSEWEVKALRGWDNAYAYVAREFPKYYRRMADMAVAYCNERGIPVLSLVDAEELNTPETLFVDTVHLNDVGTEVVARVIAERLKKLPAHPAGNRLAN